MRQNRILAVLIIMLLTMMIFMPSYPAPNTNNPIETWDDGFVLINESFENGFPPENWTNTGWQDSLYGEAYHGDHWAYSWAFGDVLTTPPLEFGVNTTLTFWYRAESSTHPMDSEVYVNDTLVWYDYGYTHDYYVMATVNLDSFSGLKTIAFHGHLTGDFYGTLLDLITVTTFPFVYVDDDYNSSTPGWQSTHFDVIQDGIDAVAEGGTVYVYNGTYPENVYINKTIELVGEDKNNTIIGYNILNSKDSVIDEDFENGFPPAGWTNDGWLDSLYGTAHSGTHWAYSWTENSTLTTFLVRLSMAPTLTFWTAAESSDHPMDLEVYVNDDLVWSDYGYNHTTYEEQIVSLHNYEGVNAVIEFVGKTSGYYGQCLDDISVVDQDPYIDDVIEIIADGVSVSNFTITAGSGYPWEDYGIYIQSDNNIIHNNIIQGNSKGIFLVTSNNTQIYNNTIQRNHRGIVSLHDNYGHSIHSNSISNNWDYGAYFSTQSHNSIIYNNCIINNTILENGNNIWNMTKTPGTNIIGGPNIGGNYWSDYNGIDTNGDLLGDTEIPFGPGDYYPLTALLDVNQSTQDRGFPIRHAADGDWAGAQNVTPTLDYLTKCEIYLRKFGTPEFNLTVDLREDHPQGTLIDSIVFTQENVSSSWTWLNLNFDDIKVNASKDYFIVCPPAPSGVTTSFGYEWGYAFGNQYPDGAFWFTRDGGSLWRDLPTMYEFVFKTYGYDL